MRPAYALHQKTISVEKLREIERCLTLYLKHDDAGTHTQNTNIMRHTTDNPTNNKKEQPYND